jgi:ABC-type Fe3+/spermidine/putrescine transport system ATPase subunit
MTAVSAVSLREVCEHFDVHAVVDRVTLDITTGEFFALLDLSGCGRILHGQVGPAGGKLCQ